MLFMAEESVLGDLVGVVFPRSLLLLDSNVLKQLREGVMFMTTCSVSGCCPSWPNSCF